MKHAVVGSDTNFYQLIKISGVTRFRVDLLSHDAQGTGFEFYFKIILVFPLQYLDNGELGVYDFGLTFIYRIGGI